MVYNYLKKLQSRLFLPCIICQDKSHADIQLCQNCIDDLPKIQKQCGCCALPIQEPHEYCGKCLSQSYSFTKIQSPFLYQGQIKNLLSQFKFHGKLVEGRILAQLLCEYILNIKDSKPDLLIPAPLHYKKLRERKFNQSAEIAGYLSKQLNIPWDSHSLKKIKTTKSQNSLNRKQRLSNVKGCFTFNKRQDYQHIAIIDDVVTTGATAEAMAKAIKKKGINNIEIWAIARTP